jgi:O-antigen/teichoic acid export membrane protein
VGRRVAASQCMSCHIQSKRHLRKSYLGESIIGFLSGVAYIDIHMALAFNVWDGIFISQAVARGIWMISENLQIYRFYNKIIAVVLNISVNLLLIPKYGIAGTAISTLMTQALGTRMFSLLWKPLRASIWAMIKSINPIHLIE